MAQWDWCTLCTSSLNLGHLAQLREVVFYGLSPRAPKRRKSALTRQHPAIASPSPPGPAPPLRPPAPHQTGQQARHRGKTAARLGELRIEIARAVDLQLQRMQALARRAVALQHIAAGIRPVVCRAAPHFGKIGEGRADQAAMAGRAEAVTQHEFGRRLAAAQHQRRHRMEIEQQGRTPAIAQGRERPAQGLVIGLVDAGNPRGKIFLVVPALPQLAKAGQAARNQPEPAARAATRRIAAHIARFAAAEHVPVDIVAGPVEIEHGARRMGDQQGGPGRPRDFLRQQIDEAIFQPQGCEPGVAHALEQRAGIGSACMRHGNEDRDRRGICPRQAEGRRAGEAGDLSTLDQDRFRDRSRVDSGGELPEGNGAANIATS